MIPNYSVLQRYYKSPYWQRTRGLLIYQRNGKCELCRSTQSLQAHHKHYKHLFTEQSHMDCLQLLCAKCHADIERKKKQKKSDLSPFR